MNWHSVRVRLTLWNVLVLACVLGGFGAALCYTVQANQSAAIDRELERRARGLAERPPIFVFRRLERGEGPGPRRVQVPTPFKDPGPPPELNGIPAPPGGPQDGQPGPRGDWLPDRPGGFRPEGGPEVPFGGSRRTPVVRLPGDVGPAPIEMNGQRVREFRRPLFFRSDGTPPAVFSDDLPWDGATLGPSLRGEARHSTVAVDGEKVRVFSAPAVQNGRIVGAVQAAHPLGEQQRLADSQIRTLLLLIPAALLVAGVGGLFLTNRALRPVSDVTHAAALIGAGDLSRRLKVTGKDELAELSLTFNQMISRLEQAFTGLESINAELAAAYSKLERSYEEQRRFTGDASHELRTPLTRIKGSTSLALCGPHDADSYREALVVADQAADAMARIVQDLLLLARSDVGQLPVRLEPVEVDGLLRRAVTGLRDEPGAGIHLEVPPGRYRVLGDSDHLTRLFGNLLENALRHTPQDGTITLSAQPKDGKLAITVTDTGEGIPPQHLPHVCERFYRVDEARTGGRGGTGLGLSICQSIVQAHRGDLRIESQPGQGTSVTVTLPLAPAERPAALPDSVLSA